MKFFTSKLFSVLIILFILLNCKIALCQNFWQQTNGPYGGVINALALNGTSIYAGVEGGVYVSNNNGSSWTNTGLTDYNIFAIFPSDGNLFAGTYGDGIFLSTDNGLNWTAANNGLTNHNVYDFALINSTLFAATYGG